MCWDCYKEKEYDKVVDEVLQQLKAQIQKKEVN